MDTAKSPTSSTASRSAFTLLQTSAEFFRACKAFERTSDGRIVEIDPPYNAGTHFRPYHASRDDIDDELRSGVSPRTPREWLVCLNDLVPLSRLFLVRGDPAVKPDSDSWIRKTTRTQKDGSPPDLVAVDRDWVVLDIDSFEEPGLTMQDPQGALRSLIARYIPEVTDVTCCVRPSASAFIKPGLRLHVLVCTDKPYTNEQFKAFLELINQRVGRRLVDVGMARADLPFYTSAPIFIDDVADPAPDRSWHLLEGSRDFFELPADIVEQATTATVARTKPTREQKQREKRRTAPAGEPPAPPSTNSVADAEIADARRLLEAQLRRIRRAPYPYPGTAYRDLWNDPVYHLGRRAYLLGGVDQVEELLYEAVDERFDRVDESNLDAEGHREGAKRKISGALRDGTYEPWIPDQKPKHPYYPADHLPLRQAREQLRQGVARADYSDVVIQGVPGLGKTHATIEYIASMDRPVDVALPTRGLAEQFAKDMAERIGAENVQIIRARDAHVPNGSSVSPADSGDDESSERMCKKHEIAKAIADQGLPVVTALCGLPRQGVLCEYYKDCDYLNQFSRGARVRVFAHSYLSKRPALMERRPLLVIDETFYQALLVRDEIRIADLWSWRDHLRRHVDEKVWPYSALLFEERKVAGVTYSSAVISLIDLLLNASDDLLRRMRAAGVTAMRLSALERREREILQREMGVRRSERHELQRRAISKFQPSGARARMLLFQALAEELESEPERDISHSVYHALNRDRDPVLRICSSRSLERGSSPRGERVYATVLNLDADADPRLLQPLFPYRRGIEVIPVRAERHGYVIQCHDVPGSRRYFSDERAKSWLKRIEAASSTAKRSTLRQRAREDLWSLPDKKLTKEARRQRELLALFEREAAGGRRVLVVPTLRIRKQLQLLRDFGDSIVLAHLAELKGRNDWEAFDTVIVIGREQLRHQDAEDVARALFCRDPEPLQLLKEGQWMPHQWRGVRMRDGTVPWNRVTYHPDERVQAVMEMTREKGIVQAIDRMRGVQREASPPRIILLTSIVVDVTVDERASYDDIVRGTPAAQAYVAAAGVLPMAVKHLVDAHGLTTTEARDARRPPPGGWERYLACHPKLRPPRERFYRVEGQRRPSIAWVDERLDDQQAAVALAKALGEPVVACEGSGSGESR